MNEEVIFVAFLVLLGLGLGVVGGIMGIVALVKVGSLRQQVFALRSELQALRLRVKDLSQPTAVPAPSAAPPPVPVPPVMPTPVATPVEEFTPVLQPIPKEYEVTPKPSVEQIFHPLPEEHEVTPQPAAPQIFHPPADLQGLESRIGQRWIAWVGAVVVFLSAVFFLKLVFTNNWIGPLGQVVICVLAGAGILMLGSVFIRKGWRILGQSVMGLGLGILYATFFAASSTAVYAQPVMSPQTAFAFMVLVTAAGMTLAVLHDALSMAFLAVLGGVLTPVLVSTGQDSRDALFTYLLILNLGVLGVAFFRGWRLLETLALVGTFLLYAGWHAGFYEPKYLAPALAWLGVFYLVYLALPFTYHLVRRQTVTLERFIMALGNAVFFAGYAWYMLNENHLFTMGFVMLGMAGAYLVLGTMLRRRLPEDARALFGLIAMTVTCLTLAVPMQLQANGILLAWVAEAPVLAYLAYRFRYQPVRVFGAVILVLAVLRLFFFGEHWPLHSGGLFILLANARFLSAMAVPLAAAIYAWIHHWHKSEASALDRALKIVTALAAGLLALVILHAEIYAWVEIHWGKNAAFSTVAALWTLGALTYLWAGTRAKAAAWNAWGVGTFTLGVAAILCLGAFVHDLGKEHLLLVNLRFAAGLLLMLSWFVYAWVIIPRGLGIPDRGNAPGGAGVVYAVVGIVGLLMLLSVEFYSYCVDVLPDAQRARWAGQMSVTLVWSVYALSLLGLGFWRQLRALRLGGLVLFGLAAVKLVLIDLTNLRDVFRIVSFMGLGLLMLVVSYLYHRLEKRLTGTRANAVPTVRTSATGAAK